MRKLKKELKMNSSNLSGATDIIMVVQPDGSLRSTPFHVRFGKFQLLKSDGANVIVTVNGKKTDFKMKVGQDGKVYFEKEIYVADNIEDSSKNKD